MQLPALHHGSPAPSAAGRHRTRVDASMQHPCRCPHAQQQQQQQPPSRRTMRCRAVSVGRTVQEGPAAVVTSGLKVSFGSGESLRQVLKGVDLQIQRGSLHMLLGPNGCGKSTLLKVLGGLVPTAGGQVSIDTPTGFVFQNPDHQVVMPTVAADVAFGLGRYDLEESQVAEAVRSALELVNMGDSLQRPTHTLSGGQRQRVAIAGALAENPRILLLDELTTFLDVEDQFGVLQAVKDVTRRGQIPPAPLPTSTTPAPLPTTMSTTTTTGQAAAAAAAAQQRADVPVQAAGPGSLQGDGGPVQGPAGGSGGPVQWNGAASQPQQPPAAAAAAAGSGRAGDVTGRVAGGSGRDGPVHPGLRSDEPVTAIWVTHRFEELQYADSASYMHDGRVVFSGSAEDMIEYLRCLGAPGV